MKRVPVWLICGALVAIAALLALQGLAGSTLAQGAATAVGAALAAPTDLPPDYPPPSSTPTPKPTCPPPATPEPFWVEPVRSPTNLRYQTLKVHLGNGSSVIASSEAGTASVTGKFVVASQPAYVTVPLLPDITNHIIVTGVVEYWPDCFYTLTTTVDRDGNPLEIEQKEVPMSLPLIMNDWHP